MIGSTLVQAHPSIIDFLPSSIDISPHNFGLFGRPTREYILEINYFETKMLYWH